MIRAAFRDPAIVTAIVLVGLGIPTLGSGLAILATLVVATKTQGTLLVLAVLLIVLGLVVTLAGLVVLAYLIWELLNERRESLALLTEHWSATYSPQAKQLTVELSFYKCSDSDFRTVDCWVATGDWQGRMRLGPIMPHWTTRYRYSLTCTGVDIEIPQDVATVEVDVRTSLKDGVKKKALTRVNLFHAGG